MSLSLAVTLRELFAKLTVFQILRVASSNNFFFKGNHKEVQQNKSVKAVWGFGEWRHLAVTEELSGQTGSETICLPPVKGPLQFCEVK